MKRFLPWALLALMATASFAQQVTTSRINFKCRNSSQISATDEVVLFLDCATDKLRLSANAGPFADFGGTGTVTSVALSAPSDLFSVSGSPVTTSGTLTLAKANANVREFYGGPLNGTGAGTPAFRAIAPADLPLSVCGAGEFLTYDGAVITCATATNLPVADTTAIVKGSADATKLLRFEVDGFSASSTRVLTPPNADITIAGANYPNAWLSQQTHSYDPGNSATPLSIFANTNAAGSASAIRVGNSIPMFLMSNNAGIGFNTSYDGTAFKAFSTEAGGLIQADLAVANGGFSFYSFPSTTAGNSVSLTKRLSVSELGVDFPAGRVLIAGGAAASGKELDVNGDLQADTIESTGTVVATNYFRPALQAIGGYGATADGQLTIDVSTATNTNRRLHIANGSTSVDINNLERDIRLYANGLTNAVISRSPLTVRPDAAAAANTVLLSVRTGGTSTDVFAVDAEGDTRVSSCNGCDILDEDRYEWLWQVGGTTATSITAVGVGTTNTVGTATSGTTQDTHGLSINYASGTTANSLASGSAGVYSAGLPPAVWEPDVNIRFRDATSETNFRTWVGFADSATTLVGADDPATVHAAFRYSTAIGGNWRFCYKDTGDGGTQTCVDTGVAYSTNTVRMRVQYLTGGTSIRAYINGAMVASATWATNTGNFSHGVVCLKTTTDAVAKNIKWSRTHLRFNALY